MKPTITILLLAWVVSSCSSTEYLNYHQEVSPLASDNIKDSPLEVKDIKNERGDDIRVFLMKSLADAGFKVYYSPSLRDKVEEVIDGGATPQRNTDRNVMDTKVRYSIKRLVCEGGTSDCYSGVARANISIYKFDSRKLLFSDSITVHHNLGSTSTEMTDNPREIVFSALKSKIKDDLLNDLVGYERSVELPFLGASEDGLFYGAYSLAKKGRFKEALQSVRKKGESDSFTEREKDMSHINRSTLWLLMGDRKKSELALNNVSYNNYYEHIKNLTLIMGKE